MKILLIILSILLSGIALGEAHLGLKAYQADYDNKRQYDLGIGIWQPVFKGHLAYVSWTGCGYYPDPNHRADNWLKTEQGAEVLWGKYTVGAGAHFFRTPSTGVNELTYYGSASYKLWK